MRGNTVVNRKAVSLLTIRYSHGKLKLSSLNAAWKSILIEKNELQHQQCSS